MQLTTVNIEKSEAINFILGQTHFIKSVEDLHEALVAGSCVFVAHSYSAFLLAGVTNDDD